MVNSSKELSLFDARSLSHYLGIVESQTNNNCHTEALETIAEYAYKKYANDRSKQLLKCIRAIKTLQNFYGMANQIGAIREDIAKAILFQLTEQEKFEFNQCL